MNKEVLILRTAGNHNLRSKQIKLNNIYRYKLFENVNLKLLKKERSFERFSFGLDDVQLKTKRNLYSRLKIEKGDSEACKFN